MDPNDAAEQRLWDLLVRSEKVRRRQPGDAATLSYRNGVADAFAVLTGREPEGIYEELMDELEAEAA